MALYRYAGTRTILWRSKNALIAVYLNIKVIVHFSLIGNTRLSRVTSK